MILHSDFLSSVFDNLVVVSVTLVAGSVCLEMTSIFLVVVVTGVVVTGVVVTGVVVTGVVVTGVVGQRRPVQKNHGVEKVFL